MWRFFEGITTTVWVRTPHTGTWELFIYTVYYDYYYDDDYYHDCHHDDDDYYYCY